jgi:hypothetical protein
LKIVPLFDSSLQNAPAGFMTAVNAAIDYFEQNFLDPITVKITFSWGELQGQRLPSGVLGESSTNGYIEPFSQVVSWLTASASSQADFASLAALPTTDPTGGAMFWVSDAEAKIFGASSDPNFTDPQDGFAALSSAVPLTFDPQNRAVPGDYDAIGILEHEISEAIGRISYLGQGTFRGDTLYSPLDLFRYSSAGVHSVSPTSGYFSVDGQHMLLQYNDPNTGVDGGDWTPSAMGDAFGFGFTGAAATVSPTDLLEMDLLGFKIASPAKYDFNGDQKSDLLIENGAGAVVVGEVGASNQAAFTQVAGLGPEWKFVGVGDVLGDGNSGFLIQNTAGAVDFGEVVGGHATFSQVAGLGPEWTFVGAGDFLGSGKTDFLIENAAGAVVVGEVGAGGQANYTQVAGLGPEWKFVGVGDFMGDGKSDFLIENAAGAVAVGEVSNGQATITQVAGLGPEWKFVGTGDFLHLGDSQFLIKNSAGAVDVGAVEGGHATFTQVTGLGPEWSFVGAGDYLGLAHDQFLIENASGAVVVGDIENGVTLFTQISGLSPDWHFH